MGVVGEERGHGAAFGAGSFDGIVEQAWWRYEANLADHVSSMPPGAYITITSAQASVGQRGLRPYVDLVAVDSDRVIGIAALPSYLYPSCTTTDSADSELRRLGWTEPGRPAADGTAMDCTTARSRTESADLATLAVATLRLVWQVPHPTFLSAWTVGPENSDTGPAQLNDPPPVPHELPLASADSASADSASADSASADSASADSASADSAGADSMPRTDLLPVPLLSLHTFCELLGARVDEATVRSVCGTGNLDSFTASAYEHARLCAEYASSNRRGPASRVWAQQARSWLHTAESLNTAGQPSGEQSRPDRGRSGPDSAAKSAGS